MKVSLSELMRGNTLRSQIFTTISNTKFQSVPKLLKNSRKREAQYHPFSSQHTLIRSQIQSPNLRTDLSAQRYSPSPPSNSKDRTVHLQSTDRDNSERVQRLNKKRKVTSDKKKVQKKLNFTTGSNKRVGQQKEKSGEKMQHSRKNRKSSSKDRKKKQISQNQSKDQSSKINLESIIEQESSEENMYNHQAKHGYRGKKGSQLKFSHSEEKTKRKYKKELISPNMRLKIQKSFKQPQKFQKMLKSDILNVRFRILRRRLIEIQIFVNKPTQELSVTIDKGNVQCQNIHEQYTRLAPNTLLHLFTSIRNISIDEPLNFPKLILEIVIDEKHSDVIHKALTIPYCWLHFAEQSGRNSQKSRIKTKLCIEDVTLNPSRIKMLSLALPGWSLTHYSRTEVQYYCRFSLVQYQFQLNLKERDGKVNLQLQGRGQQRLTKLAQFISELLC